MAGRWPVGYITGMKMPSSILADGAHAEGGSAVGTPCLPASAWGQWPGRRGKGPSCQLPGPTRRSRNEARFLLTFFVLFAAPGALVAGAPAPSIDFFEKKIRPVLTKHCYECHSAQAKKPKAGLLLDSKAGMLKGGDSGPAIVPGKGKESLIVKAMMHEGDTKMPPRSEKVGKEVVADFVKWIDSGAPDPRQGKVTAVKRVIDVDQGRTFWSFRPLAAAAPPR